jgi:BirA family biotin operon repressor/biotin-[acetyl-CoA-carboxylase] ligase
MITYLTEVDSTQDTLRRAFELGGVGAFDAILAEHQTKGRGRNGHVWEAPANSSLLSSTLVQVVKTIPVHCVGFMGALAARETVAHFTTEDVSIKWPNDILVARKDGANAKKIAGIIAEHLSSEDEVNYFSVGFGLNVFQTGAELPQNTSIPATSLTLSSNEHTQDTASLAQADGREALTNIYNDFNMRLQEMTGLDQAKLRDTLLEHLYPMVRVLVTPVNSDAFEAEVVGLSDNFGLEVQKNTGETVEVISGDVKPLH